MKKILLLIFIITTMSCCEKDTEIVPVKIYNIELIDKGFIFHSPHDYKFNAIEEDIGVFRCYIRTLSIKKDDTIKSIDSFVKGKKLYIDITSSPHDFDCNADSCFSVHDLYFDLLYKLEGSYDVNISINHVHGMEFVYNFENIN